MAHPPAISEEGAAISRTEIESFRSHQDSSLVARRRLTDPKSSRLTCSIPRHAPKRQCYGSKTAKLWFQSHIVRGKDKGRANLCEWPVASVSDFTHCLWPRPSVSENSCNFPRRRVLQSIRASAMARRLLPLQRTRQRNDTGSSWTLFALRKLRPIADQIMQAKLPGCALPG